jgi:hypothetical protein
VVLPVGLSDALVVVPLEPCCPFAGEPVPPPAGAEPDRTVVVGAPDALVVVVVAA